MVPLAGCSKPVVLTDAVSTVHKNPLSLAVTLIETGVLGRVTSLSSTALTK